MYILIVDDNADMRNILSINLMNLGLDVRTAQNGREALAIVQEEPPAAVLLDLMMPVMDGFSFLATLDRKGLRGRFPVIVLSAVANSMGGARLHGAFSALQKGRINQDVLTQTLQDAGIQVQAS
jgi:CheY-like chemotaxis protein